MPDKEGVTSGGEESVWTYDSGTSKNINNDADGNASSDGKPWNKDVDSIEAPLKLPEFCNVNGGESGEEERNDFILERRLSIMMS